MDTVDRRSPDSVGSRPPPGGWPGAASDLPSRRAERRDHPDGEDGEEDHEDRPRRDNQTQAIAAGGAESSDHIDRTAASATSRQPAAEHVAGVGGRLAPGTRPALTVDHPSEHQPGHQQEVFQRRRSSRGRLYSPPQSPRGGWSHRDVSRRFGHASLISALALSPDGHTLVSGDGSGVLIFGDLVAWCERARAQGHRTGVSTLAFDPDGLPDLACNLARRFDAGDREPRRGRQTLAGRAPVTARDGVGGRPGGSASGPEVLARGRRVEYGRHDAVGQARTIPSRPDESSAEVSEAKFSSLTAPACPGRPRWRSPRAG